MPDHKYIIFQLLKAEPNEVIDPQGLEKVVTTIKTIPLATLLRQGTCQIIIRYPGDIRTLCAELGTLPNGISVEPVKGYAKTYFNNSRAN